MTKTANMIPINNAELKKAFPMIRKAMATIIEKVCVANDPKIKEDMLTERLFVGPSVPDMGLSQYLDRCVKYFRCSPACYVFAIVYLDRLAAASVNKDVDEKILLHSLNIHRLYSTALILANKFLEDQVYSNKYYAQVTGIPLAELNRYELIFTCELGFDFAVSDAHFLEYLNQLTYEPKTDPKVDPKVAKAEPKQAQKDNTTTPMAWEPTNDGSILQSLPAA